MTFGSTLLAFDFDGTLAPICADPAEARLDRGAAALLAETSHMEGVVVAIVSGRDADDLSLRVDTDSVYLIASHGLEVRAPGGVLVRNTPALTVAIDKARTAAIYRRTCCQGEHQQPCTDGAHHILPLLLALG